MATPSGADALANQLLVSLIAGKTFEIPDVEISKDIFVQPPPSGPDFADVPPVTVEMLTEGKVGGAGLFDVLMASIGVHLKEEFAKGRITGAEYTKAWTGAIQSALSTAATFLLQKDAARWQARLVQKQVQQAEIEKTKARIELETARFQFVRVRFEAFTAETAYALAKMKLATEDVTFTNLTLQGDILGIQKATGALDIESKTFANTYILPLQRTLLSEQVEVQRAQTLDVRTDGQVIVGSIGKQKDLYSQQIVSYKRDAEVKIAKFWTDAFIAMKTIDEGLQPPPQFQNINLDSILTTLRANGGLGG